MLKLDLQSRLPIYEQLKRKIGELVLTGALKPHDQLPSVRSFARDLGINPNTVQKAYQDLERDGVIYSVSGRGSYISPNEDMANMLRRQHLDAITREAAKAKQAGIPLADATEAVELAYGGRSEEK